MKKITKNIFTFLLIFIFTIFLTGCGNKDNDSDINDIINKIENKNNQNNDKNNSNDEKDTSNEYDNINLYSDDTKMVFNMQDLYYLIYYHNGKDITGLEYIYNYPDKETAKIAETAIKVTYEAEDDVEKVELKGTQLRIKFKETAYKGQTLESIKQTYSYLEEIKKN